MKFSGKKAYSAPKLTVHGTLQELTQACTDGANKQFGGKDGFFFAGQSISDCTS